MLERTQIEHADAAIGAARDEDVDAIRAEADVVDFFVVCDQLRFGGQRGDVPYCAGCVD